MNTTSRLFFVLIMISPVLLSCYHAGSDAGEVADTNISVNEVMVNKDQFAATGMVIGDLSNVVFENVIRLNGNISVPPDSKAKVSILIPGFVKQISVVEGAYVRKGESLLILENTDYIQLQQDYLEAFYSLNYFKSEYERQKSLMNDNITSQKNYLNAVSEYEKMLATSKGLEEKLRLINLEPEQVVQGRIVSEISIRAPITGHITRQTAILGMYIEPQDVIIEIVDNRDLQLRLTAFEKDISRIKPGQTIRYRKADALDEWHTGKVTVTGKSVDPESRSATVLGHISEEDKNTFIYGMYVEADIIIQGREAYGLPNEAIQKEEDKYFIFVKKAEEGDVIRFEKLYVNTGQVSEDSTEIITDHVINDILIKGAFNLSIE